MIDRGPVTIGGHCASCEHFGEEDDGSFAPFTPGYHACNLLSTEGYPAPAESRQALVIGSDFMPSGGLLVRPSFGCTQWFPASEEVLSGRGVKVAW